MKLSFSKESIFFFLIAFIVFISVVVKALLAGMSHDEAFSFYLVETNNFTAMGGTANTHWLTTIFMFVLSLFSQEEWVLRISSLLGFLIYLFAAYAFLKLIRPIPIVLLFTSLLLLNLYVLDFFSLSRGYALSMAFVLAGFYYLRDFFERPHANLLFRAFAALALSVAANYTALYIFLAVVMTVFLVCARNRSFHLLQWKTIALVLITIMVSVTNLFIIRYYGDLQYGGYSSFVQDTIGSLISRSSYDTLHPDASIIAALAFYCMLTGSSLFLLARMIRLRRQIGWTEALSFIFLNVIIIIEILHHLFDTPYPLGRTALVLYSFFSVCLTFFLQRAWNKSRLKIPTLVIVIFTCAMLFAGIRNYSPRFTHEWRNHEDAEQKLADIATAVAKEGKKPKETRIYPGSGKGVFLHYYQVIEPDKWGFSIVPYSSTIPNRSELKEVLKEADYAVIEMEEETVVEETGRKYEVLNVYPETGSKLIRFIP